jgi:two-component system LytT family response regulator
MLTTILIDDEEDSRITLRNFLGRYCPDVEVLAEADSVQAGVALIQTLKPALVFLDINMPQENGFMLFEHIPNPDFYVVFITAYDEYAIKAIRHNALDYILKPINIRELMQAVSRAQELRNKEGIQRQLHQLMKALPQQQQQQAQNPEKLMLPLTDGFVYVPMQDIIRCEASGNYTFFYFTNREKMVVCNTLGYYEEALKDYGFIRVHHQHLINQHHVDRYQRGRGGTVVMRDQKEVAVSQRKRDEFLRMMGFIARG